MDIETLRIRLGNLKVPDLKQIAITCQLRAVGKKGEIIDRLLKGTTPTALLQVLERMGKGQVLQTATYATGLSEGSYDDGMRHAARSRIDRKRDVDNAHGRAKKRRLDRREVVGKECPTCICRGIPSQSIQMKSSQEPISVINCPVCNVAYHDRCLAVCAAELPQGFKCAKCRMQDLDPFFPAVKTLHLVPLWEDASTSSSVQARRSLPLQSPNIQDLRRKGAEVFIYCLRLNNWKNPKLHEWPLTVTVNINKNQELIKKPEYEHKRRDVPMKVTPYLTGEGQNNIEVLATNFPANDPYVVALCLCDRRSAEQLQQWVLMNKRMPFAEAEAKTMDNIRSFFGSRNDDDEVDILDTSCRVRLTDPISLLRLSIPVRGESCRHLQCFDLGAFLEVTKSTKAFANRWKCVECNSIVRPADLVVDTYIEHLLQQTSKDAEGVVFDASGQWEEVQGTVVPPDSPAEPAAEDGPQDMSIEAESIDLVDLSSSGDEGASPASVPPPPPAVQRKSSTGSLVSNEPFFPLQAQQQQRRQSIEILPTPRRTSFGSQSLESSTDSIPAPVPAAVRSVMPPPVAPPPFRRSSPSQVTAAPKMMGDAMHWDEQPAPPEPRPTSAQWSAPLNPQQRVLRDFKPPNPFLMHSGIAPRPTYGPPVTQHKNKQVYNAQQSYQAPPPEAPCYDYSQMYGQRPPIPPANGVQWIQRPMGMPAQQAGWNPSWNQQYR